MQNDTISMIYEIRERIVRIETKLDQYNNTRETAFKAKELAEDNAEEIREMKDNLKWGTRTGIASLLGLIGKILYDSIVGR